MINNILLDQDGVLADFFTPAFEALKRKTKKEISREDYIKTKNFDMAEVFEITRDEFWATVDTPGTFEKLDAFPWAGALVDFLKRFAPITIASSPSPSDNCVSEKLFWLRKHLGISHKDCIFGGKKYLMARPDALLIDDAPEHVFKFIEAGGKAVLIPSNWNTPNLSYNMILETIIKSGYLNE